MVEAASIVAPGWGCKDIDNICVNLELQCLRLRMWAYYCSCVNCVCYRPQCLLSVYEECCIRIDIVHAQFFIFVYAYLVC